MVAYFYGSTAVHRLNNSNGTVNARLAYVEEDQRTLRQLFLDEMRALRGELKALTEQVRDTGRAVDTLLAELRLRDEEDTHG